MPKTEGAKLAAAVELGRLGGLVKSASKAEAVRANARKPRKPSPRGRRRG